MIITLDIETIGAQSQEMRNRIAATVKPPAQMKKAETIAKWEREDKPQAIQDAVDRSALNAAHGAICCIGWAIDDGGVQTITWPDMAENETTMIKWFFEFADRDLNGRVPVIVGHYVGGFDLRFIWQRCMILGIKAPSWMPKDIKPWGTDIQDTMHMWSGPKDTISLDNLCLALGVDGKGDVTGSDVAGLWAAGDYKAISSYCASDVERTRAVYRKMMVAFGGI